MLSPVLHPSTGFWFLGKIENHVARPLTEEEIIQHIKEHNALLSQPNYKPVIGYAWGAYTGSDENGKTGELIGAYHTTREAAEQACVGKGWYGRNGICRRVGTLTVDDKTYILQGIDPVIIGDEHVKITRLRKQALSKLTLEEMKALGLPTP